jgi:hypothetical protein
MWKTRTFAFWIASEKFCFAFFTGDLPFWEGVIIIKKKIDHQPKQLDCALFFPLSQQRIYMKNDTWI